MASPVAHAVVSWAALEGAAGRAPWRHPLLAGLVLGNLPDLDFLPGLLAGAMNRWHQGPGHSLAGAALTACAAFGLAALASGRIGRPGAVAAWCFCLSCGHFAMDVATVDLRAPVGIPLLWPASGALVHLPFTIFPAYVKPSLSALLTTPGNLSVLGTEMLVTAPVALAAYLAVRGLSRRTSR